MNLNKKFFSKIGFSYLIYAICTIAFPIIIFHIIGNGFEIVNNINFRLIISAICNYILPFPILLFLMKKLESEKLEKESLSITSFLLYFCISFTLMIIGNLLGIGVTSLIGTAIQSDIANPIQTLINSSDILLNLIIISIIGPIFEELLFRKLLIDRTIKYGAKISIILSATLFGLMHGNLNQFFYAFLLGGFFSYIYIKTGKIILCFGILFVSSHRIFKTQIICAKLSIASKYWGRNMRPIRTSWLGNQKRRRCMCAQWRCSVG